MANSRKRRRKKNQGNYLVLFGIIAIIVAIIVIFAVDSGKNEKPSDTTTSSNVSQNQEQNNTDAYSDSFTEANDPSSANEPSETETTESDSTTAEETTEEETLPLVQEAESVSDIVIAYYTDLMGFSEGALSINDFETRETATGYTFTLRVSSGGSANKLVGDVYVEKGSGDVTDNMGNTWNLSDI